MCSVANLKYLRAVIQEAMRVHPSIPVGLHQVVPRRGGAIDGQWVPGGVCAQSWFSALVSSWSFQLRTILYHDTPIPTSFLDLGLSGPAGSVSQPEVLART